MPEWMKKKMYYYGALDEDDWPATWYTATSLYDAIMKSKTLYSRTKNVVEVSIQTRPINPPLGYTIPSYRIGCVFRDIERKYIYAHYIAKSFNADPYSKEYIIKGKNIIEQK